MSGSAHAAGEADRDNTDARRGADAIRVILMTAPSDAAAESLVQVLVSERLAACGSIVPGLTSIYRWQGGVQTDAEVLVVLKATARSVPSLIGRAAELHPYDVPEVLVLPVVAGHEPYLEWVRESCS